MSLSSLMVLHEPPEPGYAVLKGFDDREIVAAFMPISVLEDRLEWPDSLDNAKANLVLEANLAAFTRIVSAKYELKEYTLYPRLGSTIRRIDLTLSHIQTEPISGSVLNLPHTWSSDGKFENERRD